MSVAAWSVRIVVVLGLLLAMVWPTTLAAIEPLVFADRAEEVRYQQLIRELRCLQCQNQSLADSPAEVASGLRNEVFRLMREGRSDAEIKVFLTERYGEFVLYRPELGSGTLMLWFGPFVILLLGAVAVTLHFRRRPRSAVQPTAAVDTNSEEW